MKMLPEVTQLEDLIISPPPHSFGESFLWPRPPPLHQLLPHSFIHVMTNCLELPCGVVLHTDKE